MNTASLLSIIDKNINPPPTQTGRNFINESGKLLWKSSDVGVSLFSTEWWQSSPFLKVKEKRKEKTA